MMTKGFKKYHLHLLNASLSNQPYLTYNLGDDLDKSRLVKWTTHGVQSTICYVISYFLKKKNMNFLKKFSNHTSASRLS